MRVPTIHLNGTSADALQDSADAAARALHDALAVLIEAGPNARDYYPQGDAAIAEARTEHDSRIARLRSVLVELTELQESIATGGHR